MKKVLLLLLWSTASLTVKGAKSADAFDMESQPIVQRLNELEGLSHHHATGVVQDKDGIIWIATWNGLNRYDGYGFTTFKPQPGDGSPMGVDRIKDIYIRDYDIYCNVEGHCFIFNIRDGKFRDAHQSWQQTQQAFSLPRKNVSKRMTGKDGIVWTVDSLGVLMQYHAPSYVKRLLWQPGCQVRTLFRDDDGQIWVCSRDDRTVRIYDAHLRFIGFLGADGRVHTAKTPFVSSVYCIYQDREGSLWMGCKPGTLLKLHKHVPDHYEIQAIRSGEGRAISDIYSICQDHWGRLWMGTMGAGLFCCPDLKGETFQQVLLGGETTPQKYKSVRTLSVVSRDILLVGTTQGLFAAKLSAASPETYRFQLHEREGDRYGSLSSSSIMCITEDDHHDLFIGTDGGGVNVAKCGDNLLSPQQTFRHFDQQEMAADFISSAFEYGPYAWFVGTNSIMGLDDEHSLFPSFDQQTWRDSLFFSDARPLHLEGGRWLFGLMDGLAVIDMDLLLAKRFVPSIVLTQVLIENSASHDAVSAHDSISMNERQRNVRITFAALDYRDRKSLTYRFRLDDGDWNNLENSHSITLLNLAPGEHRLFIESRLGTGHWAGNVKEVVLYVKPTIWQTTTAKILYVVFSLLLIFGIYRTVRTIRLSRRKQKELLQSYLELLEKYDKERHLDVAEQEEHTPEAPSPDKDERLSEVDQVFMQRVVEYVEQHLEDSDLSVVELAETLGLSKSGLYRRLKGLLGVTPKDFVVRARMNRAAMLLENTDLPVKEITYRCGFSDQSYFGKCFRSTYGVSPSEYRQTLLSTKICNDSYIGSCCRRFPKDLSQ